MRRFLFAPIFFLATLFVVGVSKPALAVTCSITTDTVIDQTYVDGGGCTAIDINASVSTTWIGTTNLGGGIVTVKSGFIMTMGSSSVMTLGPTDDFVVESNATATHSTQDPTGLQISARNITINGEINATGKGCYGSDGAENGFGPNTTTGVCGQSVSGFGAGGGGGGAGGGGGSYAGLGGAGGAAGGAVRYGSSINPTFLGSGGGGGYYYVSGPSGSGGGRVDLTASATITINGVIRADGESPPAYGGGYSGGGGGSGGSVIVRANAFTGSGSISANGGNGAVGGNNASGGGGGGRVALYYDAFGIFSLYQLSAVKGVSGGSGTDGTDGTVYALDRRVDDGGGDVQVRGTFFDIPADLDLTRNSISVPSGITLTCPSDRAALVVSSTQWLTLSDVTWNCAAAIDSVALASDVGISTTNTTITFSNATSLSIVTPAWSNVTTSIALTKSGSSSTWDVPSTLTLRDFTYTGGDAGTISANGGRLVLPSLMNLSLVSSTLATNVSSTFASLSIDALSSIDATGKGCPRSGGADDGFGPDSLTGICAQSVGGYGHGGGGSGSGGGGGSYGGLGSSGGAAGGSVIYGSAWIPDFFGSSGGGGYYYGSGPSGAGGGRVVLRVSGTLTVEGAIRADGATPAAYLGIYNGGGGGSGGSVYVEASTLTGLGSVSANGGAGATGAWNGSGGGGGGRVAVRYGALGTFNLSNLFSAKGLRGGGGASDAGPGTSYALDRLVDDGVGTLSLGSGFDFPVGGDYERDVITFSSGAQLSCPTGDSVTVSSTAELRLSGVTWSCANPLTSLIIGSSTGLATTSTTFSFSSVTSVTIQAPYWHNVTTTITMSKVGSMSSFDIFSNLTLRDFTYIGPTAGVIRSDGGVLSIKNAIALSFVSSTILSSVSSTSLTALSLDSLSSIDASAKGCAGSGGADDGFGPDTSTGICAQSISGAGHGGGGGGGGGGGAAHGGDGGTSGGGGGGTTVTYGSSTVPTLFGSGGGGGYYVGSAPGGAGGGIISLGVSGLLSVAGAIRADGATPPAYGGSYNGGGGGAGGSIYLVAGTLAGSGSISANGGGGAVGAGNASGGGGGGRLSMTMSSLTFSGTSSTTAGASGGGGGAAAGSDGSIYLHLLNQSPLAPSSLGQLLLVSGSTTGTNNPVFTFDLSDPDGADTEQYRIQIDNDSDFSSPVVDYTSALGAQGTRTFQVGQLVGGGTYTVGSSGQTIADGAYYWQVQAIDAAAAASAYTVARGGGVAFRVDTAPRSIQFAQSTASALESVTATSVRVTLDTSHFETVTVHYAVTGGTATGGGEDYTLASGTATIAAGDTSTTIPLVIVDDSVAEPSETLIITLSSPAFASLGSNTTHTYTILDNDTAGVTVSASSFSLTEGQSSSYTIVLTSAPTTTVTITPTVSGLASASPSSLSFTSLNWSTPQTVTITATDDSIYQGTHSATVSHAMTTTAYGYSALTLGSISVSIADNDSSGGGASTASSGSAGSIAMPVTWSFTSPVIPPTAPVSSEPPSSPSPSTEPPAAPAPTPVPTPTPTPDTHVTFRAPPASVRVGDTLRFTYGYINPSTRPQTVTIVRELIDSRGRVARTSRTRATLRPGASFSRSVSERVTSRAGTYTERVRVLDGRGRSLSSSGFPVRVTTPVRGR